MREYVIFNGDESEIEFLKKLHEQWQKAVSEEAIFAMMQLGSAFHEVRHRISELEGGENDE